MNAVALLRRAMLTRSQVLAVYKGFRRELCPHVLGTRGGRDWCLFYQFAGETSQGRIGVEAEPEWKCMAVDQLERVELREGPWHTGTSHRREQTCVEFVELDVN